MGRTTLTWTSSARILPGKRGTHKPCVLRGTCHRDRKTWLIVTMLTSVAAASAWKRKSAITTKMREDMPTHTEIQDTTPPTCHTSHGACTAFVDKQGTTDRKRGLRTQSSTCTWTVISLGLSPAMYNPSWWIKRLLQFFQEFGFHENKIVVQSDHASPMGAVSENLSQEKGEAQTTSPPSSPRDRMESSVLTLTTLTSGRSQAH